MTWLTYFVSLLLLFITAITRPDHASCGDGYALQGIRPSGVFRCRPVSTLPDPGSGVVEDKTLDGREVESRVYCTGGSIPVTNDDGVRVGCEARH